MGGGEEEEVRMSFVLQRQPGAITELEPYATLITGRLPADGQFVTEDRRPLYFLGISLGMGTCANGRQTHAAVFGWEEPFPARKGRENLPLSTFAVLIRSLTRGEFREARSRFDSPCLEGVELLELVETRGSQVIFRRTGRLAVYVNLV